MEKITLNINGKHGGLLELDVREIIESRDGLSMTLNDKACHLINPGQRLILKRHIYCDDGSSYALTEYVTVLSEDGNHVLTTTLPPRRKVMIDWDSPEFRVVDGNGGERGFIVVKCGTPHNIFAQDLDMAALRKPQVGEGYTGTECGHEIVFYNYQGDEVYRTADVAVLLKRSDREVTIDDCIQSADTVETCGKPYRSVDEYRYDFMPERASRDCLIVYFDESEKDEVIQVVMGASYFIPKYNPFYWYYVNYTDGRNGRNYETDKYGDMVKHCILWGDAWWDNVLNTSMPNNYVAENRTYTTGGRSGAALALNNAYWDVNTGIGMKGDLTSLGSDDEFKDAFVEHLKETLIPDIIDMERVKYSPMICPEGDTRRWKFYKWVSADNPDDALYTTVWYTADNTDAGKPVNAYSKKSDGNFELLSRNTVEFAVFHNLETGDTYALLNTGTGRYYYPTDEIAARNNNLSTATGITFSLHFRKRAMIADEDRGENTQATSGNVYYDGWYIDSDSGDTAWWNGFDYNGSGFSASTFEEYINESGLTSDLIGYLNFTDNDVYYRKLKVSQTFIRLLFYDSTDPLTQRLLYTSTVFLDGGTLYGKYIKQLLYMEDSGYTATMDDNENALVVFCGSNAASARVDTEINITNEYDRTKSAEGFNIYLFAEDKMYGMENGSRTIYMKVEFNHAGNGKTLPMIQWPKSGSRYTALTVSNFMESLYIPIELAYYEDKYVYYIPSAFENGADGNIRLVLFEPKIDNESETANINAELARPLPGDWEQQIKDMASQID